MKTDTQSDVATKKRTKKTKGEEQHDVIHHPGNDVVGINQSDGNSLLLPKICVREINIVPMRRPTNSWKGFQEPLWILCRCGCWENDQGKGNKDEENLQRDRIHVDWEIRSEKGGPALVAVEEGWSDLQHIHDP
jgi:hypothetical protein